MPSTTPVACDPEGRAAGAGSSCHRRRHRRRPSPATPKGRATGVGGSCRCRRLRRRPSPAAPKGEPRAEGSCYCRRSQRRPSPAAPKEGPRGREALAVVVVIAVIDARRLRPQRWEPWGREARAVAVAVDDACGPDGGAVGASSSPSTKPIDRGPEGGAPGAGGSRSSPSPTLLTTPVTCCLEGRSYGGASILPS